MTISARKKLQNRGGKCNRQLCKLLPFCQNNWKRKIWEDGALKCPTYTESQFRLPILDTPLLVFLESLASKIQAQKGKREQKMSSSLNLPQFLRPQLGVANGREVPTEFCHEKNIVGCKLENKRQHWKHLQQNCNCTLTLCFGGFPSESHREWSNLWHSHRNTSTTSSHIFFNNDSVHFRPYWIIIRKVIGGDWFQSLNVDNIPPCLFMEIEC